jgi:hypothetical protein
MEIFHFPLSLHHALEAFLERKPEGRLFDLMPSGEIAAREIRPLPRENR